MLQENAAVISAVASIVAATISAIVAFFVLRTNTRLKLMEIEQKDTQNKKEQELKNLKDQHDMSEAKHKAIREQIPIAIECQKLSSVISNLTWRTVYGSLLRSHPRGSPERSLMADKFREELSNSIYLLQLNLYLISKEPNDITNIDNVTNEAIKLCHSVWLNLGRAENFDEFINMPPSQEKRFESAVVSLETCSSELSHITNKLSKQIAEPLTFFLNSPKKTSEMNSVDGRSEVNIPQRLRP